ncbi:unnamed protein product [Scytosiphon promiscuus]
MQRRHRHHAIAAAAVVVACFCCGKIAAAAAANTAGSFAGATRVLPGPEAQRMKEQAAALHRAGEYEEAAEEFARAAALLETAGVGELASPPALNAIRLSLAASQLKCGDLGGAEATCSQLLRTPGLSRPIRQKASYRRGVSRRRQAEEAKGKTAASRLAQKAYRDVYLAVELSQSAGAAGPTAGDPKAVKLMAEMEAKDWGQGRLSEADRLAARSKADKYLASLPSVASASPGGGPGGGMFDMFGGSGTGGVGAGGSGAGVIESRRAFCCVQDAATPHLAHDGMLSLIMSGNPVPGKLLILPLKPHSSSCPCLCSMLQGVKKQLRNPSTQQLVCSFLKQAQPETLMSLAAAAGFPGANEVMVGKVSSYLQEADGKTLESWIDYGEIASGLYRRMSQMAVLWSRGIALAGIWLVWVWIRACFAPIAVQAAP